MDEYKLHIGAKTRFLNVFRRFFLLPFAEKFLLRKVQRNPGSFWRKLIPPNYLYRKGAIRREQVNGVWYLLDISLVMEHLVYFRIAPENFAPVEEKLLAAKVIVDVGANIGGTMLYFAHMNPRATVYAFEPHPDTFRKAQANLQLNGFPNVHLFPLGLGAEKGRRKLYQVHEHNAGMNRILPDDLPLPATWVELTTLDAFCLAQGISCIDFLKIDVEGFESFVLAGGTDMISRCHPLIYLELYDHGLKQHGYAAGQLINQLQEMGYNRIRNAYTMDVIINTTDLKDCDFDIIAEQI